MGAKFILKLSLFGVLVSQSQAQPQDFSKFYKGFTDQMIAAYAKRQFPLLGKVLTPDFTFVPFGDKPIKRAEFLKTMNQQFVFARGVVATIKVTKQTVGPTVATVDTYNELNMKIFLDMKEKMKPMRAKAWNRETWVKSGSIWKLKRIVDTKKPIVTVNGVPWDPSTRPGMGGKPRIGG